MTKRKPSLLIVVLGLSCVVLVAITSKGILCEEWWRYKLLHGDSQEKQCAIERLAEIWYLPDVYRLLGIIKKGRGPVSICKEPVTFRVYGIQDIINKITETHDCILTTQTGPIFGNHSICVNKEMWIEMLKQWLVDWFSATKITFHQEQLLVLANPEQHNSLRVLIEYLRSQQNLSVLVRSRPGIIISAGDSVKSLIPLMTNKNLDENLRTVAAIEVWIAAR